MLTPSRVQAPKGRHIPAWGASPRFQNFMDQALKARHISFVLARYTGLSALNFFMAHLSGLAPQAMTSSTVTL